MEKGVSLNDLDITKPCDNGFEFEYISDVTGKSSGVFITVVGAHSDRVKSWIRTNINRLRQREAMQAKKGRDEVRSVEDDEQFSLENAANRIIAWRGITDECNFKNAVLLCTVNPEIRDQVLKHSEDLGNFIKSK